MMRWPRLHVCNVHERFLPGREEEIGLLIDTLGGPEDMLWPRRLWPPLTLWGPREEGTPAGHGPIRYVVDRYEAGRNLTFRFTAPEGFEGSHRFEVEEVDRGTILRHVIEMDVSGPALLSWALVLRPLHDAILEDALTLAEGINPHPGDWSPYVKVLRRLMAPRRRTPRSTITTGV